MNPKILQLKQKLSKGVDIVAVRKGLIPITTIDTTTHKHNQSCTRTQQDCTWFGDSAYVHAGGPHIFTLLDCSHEGFRVTWYKTFINLFSYSLRNPSTPIPIHIRNLSRDKFMSNIKFISKIKPIFAREPNMNKLFFLANTDEPTRLPQNTRYN